MRKPAPLPVPIPSSPSMSGAHAPAHHPQVHTPGSLAKVALAALGIVYGDIGTSPLYTLKECMTGEHGVAPTPANLLGVLSLIFWSLTLVVTVKYLTFIMKADNRGEGGILALLALIPERFGGGRGRRHRGVSWVALLVIIGASLLYGDGVITPAISVLGAVEGLEVATTSLKPAVVPITCAILVMLFSIQSRGTGIVGKLFGPVMLVWFSTLAALGVNQIVRNPSVFVALSPHHAIRLFAEHGFHGFKLLGSVVLAVTGGEALYADMGHFGAKPIRMAWLLMVCPALILAYFGQGALLLAHPEAASNPFYEMVPKGPATYALVALATMAAVIASQALISGAFSLTHQAVQLGFFPRVSVRHTSRETEGQIYIPEINWGIALACILLVLVFKGSSALAAAYGIAVSGTMAITSVAYFLVTRQRWKWTLARSLPLVGAFLVIDLAFFGANALKFFDGGYVPIFIGAAAALVMITWKRGRAFLGEHFTASMVPLDDFLANLEQHIVTRVPGAAVFMASNPKGTPPVMVHHAKRIKVLHETVVLLSVVFEHDPTVERHERLSVSALGKGFYRVVARYGFMQQPDVPELLADAVAERGLPVDLREVTYYLGRETFLATGAGKMGKWSERLFSFLSKNSRTATKYFGLPSEQVVEIGTQIDL